MTNGSGANRTDREAESHLPTLPTTPWPLQATRQAVLVAVLTFCLAFGAKAVKKTKSAKPK